MHKRRVNELKIDLTITPDGPILIKSGDDGGLDPTLPTMNFVRILHPRSQRQTIYLPGSSLKGVIRSHSERILRTVFGDAPETCCNPLARDGNCFDRVRNIRDTAEQYQKMCLACRTFGHMANASHFLTADAYPVEAINELTVRQNIAIDRLSGGVAVGPFDMEVAMDGEFEASLSLFNFELWQVGLLALTLRDLAEGRVRLGFAKSRGLGAVNLTLNRLELGYPGQFGAAAFDLSQTMVGVGTLAPELRANYGYVTYDDTWNYPQPASLVADSVLWGRPAVVFGADEIHGVLTESVRAWARFVNAYRQETVR